MKPLQKIIGSFTVTQTSKTSHNIVAHSETSVGKTGGSFIQGILSGYAVILSPPVGWDVALWGLFFD